MWNEDDRDETGKNNKKKIFSFISTHVINRNAPKTLVNVATDLSVYCFLFFAVFGCVSEFVSLLLLLFRCSQFFFFSRFFSYFSVLKNHSFAQSNSESCLCLRLFFFVLRSQVVCVFFLSCCSILFLFLPERYFAYEFCVILSNTFGLLPPTKTREGKMKNESLLKESLNCFRDRLYRIPSNQWLNGFSYFRFLLRFIIICYSVKYRRFFFVLSLSLVFFSFLRSFSLVIKRSTFIPLVFVYFLCFYFIFFFASSMGRALSVYRFSELLWQCSNFQIVFVWQCRETYFNLVHGFNFSHFVFGVCFFIVRNQN